MTRLDTAPQMRDSPGDESIRRSLLLRERAMHDKVSRDNFYKRKMEEAIQKGITLEEHLAEEGGRTKRIIHGVSTRQAGYYQTTR